MLKLFDTHAHYDDERFETDRDSLIASLPENGVELVVNPSSNIESARKVLEIINRHAHVYGAVGTHPHDAEVMSEEDIAEYYKMAAENKKIKAIGEIGLDYYYDHSPREIQKKRLIDQMALAEELDLPVIIHDRDAHEDTLNILRQFPRVRGVVHCYSGSLEMAEQLLKIGYNLSFTGVITYKNAKKPLEIIANMPHDRIMIETDSPYLTPEPKRGSRNDSRNVVLVAEKIAQILKMDSCEVASLTMENGKRFFGI